MLGMQTLHLAMLEHLRLHFNNEEASDEQVIFLRLFNPAPPCLPLHQGHYSTGVPAQLQCATKSTLARQGRNKYNSPCQT